MKWCILLILAIMGCAGSDVRQSTSQQTSPPPAETVRQERPDEPANTVVREKEGPPGSPVASANYRMKEAEEKMTDALELIERTQDGDMVLDCRTNAPGAFEVISGFFNHRPFFQYNDAIFWFESNDGKQVGIDSKAELRQCRCGRWWTNKLVIAYQYRGESEVRTEFYIDEKEGTLSVHHYLDNKRISNENHVLKGY